MNTLELNGKRYELVEIPEEPKRKTGYERNANNPYFADVSGYVIPLTDKNFESDKRAYESANYYTDEQLAQDNVRADALMRRLRRFSAEGRKQKIDWGNSSQNKYYISCQYCGSTVTLYADFSSGFRRPGAVYFDTRKLTEECIEKYRDELIWYFTQYQDTAEFREDVQTDD